MIDRELPDTWPPAVIEAMARFRQGHILEWTTVAYGANFEHAVCRSTSALGNQGVGYVKLDDNAFPYAIILSQTCDVCEEGRAKPRIPWISVAPVYDVLPETTVPGQEGHIRAGRVGYFVPLTAQRFQRAGELWVADLRNEFPLEKSLLVGKDPIEAFATEEEYGDFANQLAFRRNRPAIDDRVRNFITLPLGRSMRAGDIIHAPIREIRLQCKPSWNRVEQAQLVVVVHESDDVESVAGQFADWETPVSENLPSGLSLIPTTVVAYDEFRYSLSRSALPIDYLDISEN